MGNRWNTKKIILKYRQEIRDRLELAGELVESSAKLRCPVRTGNLRGSINHRRIDNETVRIGTPVEYAPYVELGTQKMAAQPFLVPALKESKRDVIRILGG